MTTAKQTGGGGVDCSSDLRSEPWFRPRKLIPTLLLLALAIVAAGTDWLTPTVHEKVSTTFKGYWDKLLPMLGDFIIAALFFSLFHLLYDPISSILNRFLNRSTHITPTWKSIMRWGLRLVYWVAVLFFIGSVFAPQLLAQLFLGFSLFTAALALSLQGVLKDIIAGAFLQFSPKFAIGDYIEIVGMTEVKGRVESIGYLSTRIAPEGKKPYVVPNAEIWAKTVHEVDPPGPPKSSILIP